MLLVDSASGIWGMKTALEKGCRVTVSSDWAPIRAVLLDEFVPFFSMESSSNVTQESG